MNLKRYYEIILPLSIFWIIVVFLLYNSIIINEGHIIYSLDDAYIHMAIAKNFAKHGVWGVTKYEFTSSSSSILFTLLLSFIFLLCGVNEIVPLIINIIASHLLIVVSYSILKKNDYPQYVICFGLLSILLFASINNLVLTGMEHIFQDLIFLIYFYISTIVLVDNREKFNLKISFNEKILFFVAPLVTLIRYEGTFLIIIISFLFIIKKKYLISLILSVIGFAPIIIYGMISLYMGWYFFPNSIILKGTLQGSSSFNVVISKITTSFIYNFSISPHLIAIICICIIILYLKSYRKKDLWNPSTIMSIILISTILLQVTFAQVGLFQRYDSYLVVFSIFTFLFAFKEDFPKKLSLNDFQIYLRNIKNKSGNIGFFKLLLEILFFGLILTPFAIRSVSNFTYKSTKNIYEQQYQMGLFLKKYYNGDAVAVNDIGAVCYLSDVKLIDLVGLGTQEVAEKKISNDYSDDEIYKLTRKYDCKIAIIYEDWFDVPSNWTKVGEWKISENIVCNDDTISFYAVDPDEINDLIENLKAFSSKLPPGVKESGIYV